MLEDAYDRGDYRIGISRSKDLKSAIANQEGEQSITIGHVHAWKAILHASLSNFDKYKQELDTSKVILQNASADSSNYHDAVFTLSKALAIYGNYGEAISLLQKSKPDLISTPITFHKYKVQETYYNSKIGYLVDAQETLAEEITNIEAIRDTSQKLNLLKAKTLFQNYDFLFEVGKYNACYDIISKHESWIKETYGYQKGIRAEFLLRQARLQSHMRNYSKANSLYKKAYSYGMHYYTLHAPFFITLQSERVENLKADNKIPESEYWINDLDVRILSYYGRKSIPFLTHKLTIVNQFCEQGSWDKAETYLWNMVRKYKKLPTNHEARLEINDVNLKIKLQLGKLNEADSILNESINIALEKFSEQSPFYHYLTIQQTNLYFTYTNTIHELDEAYKQSLYTVLKPHLTVNHQYYCSSLFGLVELQNLNEDYNEANKTIESFLEEVNPYAKLRFSQALVLSSITKTNLGKYNESKETIKKALWNLKDGRKEADKLMYAKAFRTKAELMRQMGDFKDAETNYLNSDRLFNDQLFSTNKTPIEDIAWLHIYKGRYTKTSKQLQTALINKNQSVTAEHYSNIPLLLQSSEINIQLGDFSKAEENLSDAKRISETVFGTQSAKYASVLLQYKKLYEAIGDLQRSEEYAKKAVTTLSNKFGERHIKVAQPISELALATAFNHDELQSNNWNTSAASINNYCDSLLNTSKEIISLELGDDNLLYAALLENIGKYKMIVQDLDQSSENISLARDIWSETLGEPNTQTAKLDHLLGDIAYLDSSYAAALNNFTKAKNGYKNLFGTSHPNYIEALGMSARMHYIQQNTKEAAEISEEVVDKSLTYIRTIFPSLTERGKSNYWSKVKEHFEFFYTIAFTQNDANPNLIGKAYDINLQTKAILLNSSLKTKNYIMQSGDSLLINSFETWMEKKDLLITAISMEQSERKKEGINLLQLENEIENLEKYLGKQAVGFSSLKTNSNAYKWSDVSELLAPEDRVIEIIAFRLFDKAFTDEIWYAGMGVAQNMKNNPEHVIIKNGKFLHEKGLMYYRKCMEFKIKDNHSYEFFWKPIESMASKTGRTFISFDGVYNQINLETIPLSDKGFVLNKYQLIPIGTSRDLLEKQKKVKTAIKENSIVFVGDPTFYPSDYTAPKRWSQLPGTELEVNRLNTALTASNWSTKLYKHNTASEAVVKNIHQPKVFHIATHGFYLEKEEENNINKIIRNTATNPLLRSGILLKNGGEVYEGAKAHEFNRADGILTAYEAMNLDLESTELVVLSACETGLGEIELGEGVFGLQRSFVIAGAETIIISLFEVSDEVTTELMTIFYNKWKGNISKSRAFIEAKKEIMIKYDSPIYWGAFLMIGTE